MERNADRIKKLRYELGRRDKKIADQERELAELRDLLEQGNAGSRETQAAVDALMTAAVLACGTEARDPDRPEAVLGKRLELPVFNVRELLERYEIHARRDGSKMAYVLAVAPRQADGAI